MPGTGPWEMGTIYRCLCLFNWHDGSNNRGPTCWYLEVPGLTTGFPGLSLMVPGSSGSHITFESAMWMRHCGQPEIDASIN